MEKLRHEINRMVDEIPIPDQKLDETVQTAVMKAKKQEKYSFFKIQNMIAAVASVFVLAFGVLLLNSYQETASGDNTTNTSILYQQGDEALKRMVTEGYAQDIEMEAEDQGIKVLLEEGYVDNHQLAISFKIESEKQLDSLPETTDISYELFVDGISQGISGWGGVYTKDMLENGEVFIFYDTKNIDATSEFKLQITNINGIEGNWVFDFHLNKEMELLVQSDFPDKVDELGNSFDVNSVEMTPSTLKINFNANLLVDRKVEGHKDFSMEVIGIGSNGEMYIPASYSIKSFNSHRKVDKTVKRYFDVMELPRGANVDTYKIFPYITTIQGEEFEGVNGGYGLKAYEHTAPFAEGEIIGVESEVKVESIIQEKEATVVTYAMEYYVPIFPKIINKEKEEYIYAASFKDKGDKVEVTYPKVDIDKNTKFHLYDATYQVFPELETTLDLK